MEQDFDYTKFIDRYLMGEMDPEELKWFKKELEGNLNLSKEVNLHKKVNTVLTNGDMIDLKNQLDQIHKKIVVITNDKRNASKHIYQKIFYQAATLIVLILSVGLYFNNRDLSTNKIIEKYYETEYTALTFRSEKNSESMLFDAMNLYNEQKYSEAIILFDELLEEDASKIGLNLYSGISHLEIKEYDIANVRFQRIIMNKPNPFVESAIWYLGMSYLITDMKDKATEQFEILAFNSKYYRKDARKILRRINK